MVRAEGLDHIVAAGIYVAAGAWPSWRTSSSCCAATMCPGTIGAGGVFLSGLWFSGLPSSWERSVVHSEGFVHVVCADA